MAVSRVPDDKANDKPDNKVMRTISLYKLFLRYLAVFCMTTVLLLGVIVLSVEAGFRSGLIRVLCCRRTMRSGLWGKCGTGLLRVNLLTGH